MQHLYWVIDRQLAGRPGPSSCPWHPEDLYVGGIRAVVSLANEEHVEDLTAYHLDHCRADFPPVTLFSKGMRKAFIYQALPVWALLHEHVTSGIPTLVHCHAGKDRTGAVLAGYLITYQGVSPEAALEQVRAVKPDAMTAPGYAEVLELLTPGRIPRAELLL